MIPKFFIGIDISKLTIDIAVLQQNIILSRHKIANSESAIKQLLSKLKADYKITRANSFLCAEKMGIYSTFLLKVCSRKKLTICMESALQIKRSLGIVRGKNDALDSLCMGEYAFKNFEHLRVFQATRKPVEQLKTMSAIRKRLIKAKGILSRCRKSEAYYYTKADKKEVNVFSDSSIKMIEEDIGKVQDAMSASIEADEKLSHLISIITSVPSVGKVIATEIIIYTNEFKRISSAKKFASYCGIAPFACTSGTSVKGKAKVSQIANKELKALLHLVALVSLRYKKSFFAQYYNRKIEEGKNKMSVINAIRNKIVHRIFSCVKNDKPYVEY